VVDVGHYAIWLAFAVAIYALVSAVVGGVRARGGKGALAAAEPWVRSAERSVYAVAGLVTLAMVGLATALLTDRFDLEFVVLSSSREQPAIFKLALWAGQAGSFLLWAWILALVSAIAVYQNRARNRTLMPWVMASLMLNLLVFVALMTFVSNADPFHRLPDGHQLSNGRGMNPLLQHPLMLTHPPMLYTGFISFAIPFSFAIAALITGDLTTTWFRTTRRWAVFAWFILGVGVMLGGRWAYEVLGWGGYWAWDPVENASLMPWLVATAYLHSVMVQEKRGMLKIWNIVLIGLTYTLCIFGTFLTRSGIVQSVHSFADAGAIGSVFLFYVVGLTALYVGLVLWRLPHLRSQNRLQALVSRETSFLANNYVFLGLTVAILMCTLYPAYSQALEGARLEVGPEFFQTFAGPLALALLFLTGVGPLVAWRQATLANLRKSFLWPGLFALTVAIVLIVMGVREFYPVAFISLGAFVIGTVWEEYYRGIRARMRQGENLVQAFFELIRRNQRRYAGYIVHVAIVFMFFGFAGANYDIEATKLLKPGEKWELGGFTVEYRNVEELRHRHYSGVKARLALWQDGDPLIMLEPERRYYYQQETPSTLPAVFSNVAQDFYVILNGLEEDQSIALKAYINPLVNWIWIGGGVFIFANVLLLWPVPERKTSPKE
jgi:cytochrome c-type biogenesis protein CcmF